MSMSTEAFEFLSFYEIVITVPTKPSLKSAYRALEHPVGGPDCCLPPVPSSAPFLPCVADTSAGVYFDIPRQRCSQRRHFLPLSRRETFALHLRHTQAKKNMLRKSLKMSESPRWTGQSVGGFALQLLFHWPVFGPACLRQILCPSLQTKHLRRRIERTTSVNPPTPTVWLPTHS